MFEKQLKSPLRSPLMRAILAGSGVSTPSYYLNLSSPSNVTIADGQANGTITSTYNAVITASMSPSRTTGVAPLYVNFDMTGTTSTDSTNPTHECFFATDFGDSGAGTWANGVQSAGLTSKNAGYGPVTGHVYETPGTYHPSMTVLDGNGNLVTKTGTVVVDDPDVVYAGTNTICISHSGNFTGAPSGAELYPTPGGSTDMYAAWIAKKASNKRILFCKADAWTTSATIDANGLSNMIVGGYGTGVAHTFSPGTTMVSVTPDVGYFRTFQGGGGTDIRFCEFRITGTAINDGCGSTSATGTQITWYKCEVRGATESFANYPSLGLNSLYKHEQSCFYECLSDDLYGYAGQNPPSFASASAAIGTPGIFTAAAHNFNRFNKVRLFGTAPAGLSLATDYYISGTNLTANTFSLSATRWPDTPLAITGTGTCTVTAISLSGGMAGFIALTNGGIMGCYFDNGNHGEQTLRIPYVNSSHISNNYIARPNQTKNVLKMHPRGYTNTVGVSTGYSEKIVVSGNEFDLRGGYSYNVAIPNNGQTATAVGDGSIIAGYGNSGEGADERMRNVIVENNITYASLGHTKNTRSFISAQCPNFTVRNNIADFSLTTPTSTDIYTHLHFAGVGTGNATEPTVGVYIYNNTMYSNMDNAETAYFVRISNATSPYPDQTTIKNNIWYVPNHPNANRTVVYNPGSVGTNITTSNNTDVVAGSGALTSPNFVATPPVALTDWRPNTGSYAIDAGATVPVLRDFNNASRYGGTYDLGAVLP